MSHFTVLINDFDPDSASANDIISIVDFTQTAKGLISLNAEGNLVYTPTAGIFFDLDLDATATDRFEYTISDIKGLTSTTTVNIEVLGVTDIKISLGGENPSDYEFISGLGDLLSGSDGNDSITLSSSAEEGDTFDGLSGLDILNFADNADIISTSDRNVNHPL